MVSVWPERRDACMTETEYNRKLDELDRLINDPAVPMQPHRIWELLGEVADRDAMSRVMPVAGDFAGQSA